MGFSLINHPAIGVPPWLWKAPYCDRKQTPDIIPWGPKKTILRHISASPWQGPRDVRRPKRHDTTAVFKKEGVGEILISWWEESGKKVGRNRSPPKDTKRTWEKDLRYICSPTMRTWWYFENWINREVSWLSYFHPKPGRLDGPTFSLNWGHLLVEILVAATKTFNHWLSYTRCPTLNIG